MLALVGCELTNPFLARLIDNRILVGKAGYGVLAFSHWRVCHMPKTTPKLQNYRPCGHPESDSECRFGADRREYTGEIAHTAASVASIGKTLLALVTGDGEATAEWQDRAGKLGKASDQAGYTTVLYSGLHDALKGQALLLECENGTDARIIMTLGSIARKRKLISRDAYAQLFGLEVKTKGKGKGKAAATTAPGTVTSRAAALFS
jgi:hypothetical protein